MDLHRGQEELRESMSDNTTSDNFTYEISESDTHTAALTSALRKLYDSGLTDEEISLIINMNCGEGS